MFAMPHGKDGIGSRDPGVKAAMRGREIVFRAGLAGEEQVLVDRCGQGGAAIRHARQRIRIGAARKRVGAPAMHMDWFYAARKAAAEEGGQFRYREIEEGALALGF